MGKEALPSCALWGFDSSNSLLFLCLQIRITAGFSLCVLCFWIGISKQSGLGRALGGSVASSTGRAEELAQGLWSLGSRKHLVQGIEASSSVRQLTSSTSKEGDLALAQEAAQASGEQGRPAARGASKQ